MRYLLDTHALIWFLNGDDSLPTDVLNKVSNKNNDCYISIASIWEIAIKCNIGKLLLKTEFKKIAEILSDNDVTILPIEFDHLKILLNLELIHRDPFDTIIIAQGVSRNLTILTRDDNFKHYPVKSTW